MKQWKETFKEEDDIIVSIWRTAEQCHPQPFSQNTRHTHTHTHTHTPFQCVVTDHVLAQEFTELAEELGLTDGDGELCHVKEEEGAEEEEHGGEFTV